MDADGVAIQRWMTERDPEAFRVLVVRYSAMVYSTCRRVMRNAADAEDAAQESFQALAMLRQPPKGDLGPWLHRVAVYKSLNRLRSEARREARGRAYAKQQVSVEPAWNDLYEYVDEAISGLPEKYRLPVVRHFLQCETQEAIAQSMGLTRQTVAYRIQRGLDGIRKSLRRRGIVVSAAALSVMFAAHTLEAAPETLLAALGKVALLGKSVPIQPASFASRLRAGLFSAKGLAVLAAIAAVAIAVDSLLYYREYSGIEKLKHNHAGERVPAEHAPKSNTDTRLPRLIPPKAPAVAPEIEAVAANQTPALFAAPAEVPNMGEIRGVLRSASGETLAGVEVRLTRNKAFEKAWGDIEEKALEWTATTDDQGMFAFAGLPVCNKNVLRGKQYFRLSAESGGERAERTFDRRFWEVSSFEELALSPIRYIEIAAFNEQGAPVTNGAIRMEDASRMFRQSPAPDEVTLGPDGLAKAGPFYPGPYSLKIHAPGYADAEQIVSYDAGQARFVLTPEAAITGKVVDAGTRAPLAGVVLVVTANHRKRNVDRVVSGPDGAFALALRGEASLSIYARLGDKCLPGGWQQVAVDAGTGAGITLELVQGCVISGRALDPVSGEGVPNIPICFAFDSDPMLPRFINAYTDETGAYSLKGAAGKGEVRALDWWDAACARAVDAVPGQRMENVDFVLPKNCRIAGRVVGERNAPMPGLLVAASPIRNEEIRKMPYIYRFLDSSYEEAGSLSDAEGRFVCFMRGNTGDIYLQAMGGGCISQKIGPVELPETGLAGLLVRMETAGRITGAIVDAQSRPVPGANVVVQPLDPARGSMLLGRDWAIHYQMDTYYPACGFRPTVMGGFAFSPLLPGKYRVMAFLNASSANAPLAEQEVTVAPGGTQDVRLTIRTEGLSSVRGIVSAQGRPQPNLKLQAIGGGNIEDLIAVTGSDGGYEFTRLTGDRIWLMVSHAGKDDSLAEKIVDLVPGEAVTLDIDVPVGTARVEGTVRVNGVPAERKSVCLMPFDGASGQSFTILTDAQGRFEMPDIVAGVYVLGIIQPGGQSSAPTQSLVLVAEGQTVQHDFDIGLGIIGVTVAGIVEGERGHIIVFPGEVILEEVTEDALMALAPRAIKYLRTESGTSNYTIPGLAAGVYTVYGAAHPKEQEEGEDVLGQMRVMYFVTQVSNEQPAEIVFDFSAPELPGRFPWGTGFC